MSVEFNSLFKVIESSPIQVTPLQVLGEGITSQHFYENEDALTLKISDLLSLKSQSVIIGTNINLRQLGKIDLMFVLDGSLFLIEHKLATNAGFPFGQLLSYYSFFESLDDYQLHNFLLGEIYHRSKVTDKVRETILKLKTSDIRCIVLKEESKDESSLRLGCDYGLLKKMLPHENGTRFGLIYYNFKFIDQSSASFTFKNFIDDSKQAIQGVRQSINVFQSSLRGHLEYAISEVENHLPRIQKLSLSIGSDWYEVDVTINVRRENLIKFVQDIYAPLDANDAFDYVDILSGYKVKLLNHDEREVVVDRFSISKAVETIEAEDIERASAYIDDGETN